MIQLVPMSESDFQSYCERAIAEYAEEHVRGGRWSVEEAHEQARKEYQELLPDGLATPNQFLYTLTDVTTQTPVGMLWFALQLQAGQQVAFIYDVAIEPAFRRKGYATQAFQALEVMCFIYTASIHRERQSLAKRKGEGLQRYSAPSSGCLSLVSSVS